MSQRIAKIVNRCIRKFPVENYGLAKIIEHGTVKLEGATLTTTSPLLSLDSLPCYTCNAAATLVASELANENLIPLTLEMGIPARSGESISRETQHFVIYVQDYVNNYLVGLTPYDRILGIYPYKNVAEAAWIKIHLKEIQSKPFIDNVIPPIMEEIDWNLAAQESELDVKPLRARMIEPDVLAVSELGIRLMGKDLFLACVTSALKLAASKKYLTTLWVTDLYLRIPLGQISMVAELAKQSKSDFQGALKELKERGIAGYNERKGPWVDPSFRHEANSLLSETWPTIAVLLEKLPAEVAEL